MHYHDNEQRKQVKKEEREALASGLAAKFGSADILPELSEDEVADAEPNQQGVNEAQLPLLNEHTVIPASNQLKPSKSQKRHQRPLASKPVLKALAASLDDVELDEFQGIHEMLI